MVKKFWKVFLIFTLVFGMTFSFGTSKAEESTETQGKTYDLSGAEAGWMDQDNTYLKVEGPDGAYQKADTLISIPEYAGFEMHVKFRVPDYQEGSSLAGIRDTDTIISGNTAAVIHLKS